MSSVLFLDERVHVLLCLLALDIVLQLCEVLPQLVLVQHTLIVEPTGNGPIK